jgi:integrase
MREEASGAFPSTDCACAGAGPSYWSTTARCRAGERLFKHPREPFGATFCDASEIPIWRRRRLGGPHSSKDCGPPTGLSGVRLVVSEQPGGRSLAGRRLRCRNEAIGRTILESAVEYGYLQTNPARGVKFPQKGLKEKPAIIEGESLVKLLDGLGEPYRTMVQLIAATGLRIGELLALRWSALDLDVGTLAVRESVFEGRFQPPKTVKAMRTIPLGSHAVAALSRHRDASSRRGPNDLVFGNRKGEPFRESKMLTRGLQPAAESAGLGRVTWHQFRHIHSSLLNDLRVPAKIAQEQLGRASISTTLGIYTHVVDASHRAAVTAVEDRLFGVMLRHAPKSEGSLANAAPASDSVN